MEELAVQVAALVAQAAEAAARERSWRAEAQQQQDEWARRGTEREVLFQQEMMRVSAARSAEQDSRDEILDLQRRLLTTGTTGGPATSRRRPMVDTKGLGRPPTLRPDGKDWTTFQFRVENYLESFTAGARDALTWSSEQNTCRSVRPSGTRNCTVQCPAPRTWTRKSTAPWRRCWKERRRTS
jgi:hypothetical protein